MTGKFTGKTVRWYEGYAPGFASTNNGLKTINSTIKNENTLRSKLPLGDFFSTMEKIVSGWSQDRNLATPSYTIFSLSPSHTLKIQTKYFMWSIDKTRAPVKNKATFYA